MCEVGVVCFAVAAGCIRLFDKGDQISLALDILSNAELLKSFLRGFATFFFKPPTSRWWDQGHLLPLDLF